MCFSSQEACHAASTRQLLLRCPNTSLPCEYRLARRNVKYLGLPEGQRADYEAKQAGGLKALSVMERQLQQSPYLVGEQLSVADISLYAYTHVAHEGGFELSNFPAIQSWLGKVAATPGYVAMK